MARLHRALSPSMPVCRPRYMLHAPCNFIVKICMCAQTACYMMQVQLLVQRLKEHDKRLTVGLCHDAMHAGPDTFPAGCQDRLQQAHVGEERWHGLADTIGLDLTAHGAGESMAEIEEAVNALLSSVGKSKATVAPADEKGQRSKQSPSQATGN